MSDTVLWLQSYSSQLRVLPVLLMLVLLVCLVGLGRWKQVTPYGPLAIVLLGPCLLSLALVLYPQAFPAGRYGRRRDPVGGDGGPAFAPPATLVFRRAVHVADRFAQEAACGFADDHQPQRPSLAGLDPRRRAAGV